MGSKDVYGNERCVCVYGSVWEERKFGEEVDVSEGRQ